MSAETRRSPRSSRDNETAARRRADADDQAARRQAGQDARRSTSAPRSRARGRFLKLAQTLEDTGVSAYNGAAPLIKSSDVLARGRLDRAGRGAPRGADPPACGARPRRPTAFDAALDKHQVLDAVMPFVRS